MVMTTQDRMKTIHEQFDTVRNAVAELPDSESRLVERIGERLWLCDRLALDLASRGDVLELGNEAAGRQMREMAAEVRRSRWHCIACLVIAIGCLVVTVWPS